MGALGAEVRVAVQRSGTDYEARRRAAGKAYVRFATRDAALLELMFAGRRGREVAPLQEAATGAVSALAAIVQEGQASGVVDRGDSARMGPAALRNGTGHACSGQRRAERLDGLVSDAIPRFLRGRRTVARVT
jgi:hypothetical protein